MIKIILKIDDVSFRQHTAEQEEANSEIIKKYIQEEIMEALGTFCLEDLPELAAQGFAQDAEFMLDIRDTYEDLPLPAGED